MVEKPWLWILCQIDRLKWKNQLLTRLLWKTSSKAKITPFYISTTYISGESKKFSWIFVNVIIYEFFSNFSLIQKCWGKLSELMFLNNIKLFEFMRHWFKSTVCCKNFTSSCIIYKKKTLRKYMYTIYIKNDRII